MDMFDLKLPLEIIVYIVSLMDNRTKLLCIMLFGLHNHFKEFIIHNMIYVYALRYKYTLRGNQINIYDSNESTFHRMINRVYEVIDYYNLYAKIIEEEGRVRIWFSPEQKKPTVIRIIGVHVYQIDLAEMKYPRERNMNIDGTYLDVCAFYNSAVEPVLDQSKIKWYKLISDVEPGAIQSDPIFDMFLENLLL